MKLLKLESGSELSGVVELKEQPDGSLEGIHSVHEDTLYLIVDDDVDIRDFLRRYFEAKGWDEESVQSVLERVS